MDDRATQAVLTLLGRGPYTALTMEAIAVTAGTSKPALRRRWNSLPGVVVHALISVLGTTPTLDTGCVRCDLLAGISNLADGLTSSSVANALPGLVSDFAGDSELKAFFFREYFEPRRNSTRAALERAIARGEIYKTIDMELTPDLLAAPLYYRALFGHQPIDAGLAERIVLSVLGGIASPDGNRLH
ncbi:TetR-like C-terminal domain-containing protein [Subtercola sp. RTI3]|nr:TetR-like C-terminal domain-containing protein [Subtercola vilae]MEA9986706.1 TetR-like C-terminal domain-containing protein [Subtercola sp. RTI3]